MLAAREYCMKTRQSPSGASKDLIEEPTSMIVEHGDAHHLGISTLGTDNAHRDSSKTRKGQTEDGEGRSMMKEWKCWARKKRVTVLKNEKRGLD